MGLNYLNNAPNPLLTKEGVGGSYTNPMAHEVLISNFNYCIACI
jgi:hypothetical protein